MFQYVNQPLADRLNRSPDKIVGRTDLELGNDRAEYLESDRIVLTEGRNWEGFEPNFEIDDDVPVVYTTKRPIIENGSVVGLVGICEPGTPRLVEEAASRLFSDMPIFASLKDREGYVKWANRALCERDVGLTLREILSMNDGRGATDIDLYGTKDAKKFRELDREVMELARKTLASGMALTSDCMIPKKEWHYFKVDGRQSKVEVTKVPWVNIPEKKVLGVLVFYHEISDSQTSV